jgi:hypothetical protein
MDRQDRLDAALGGMLVARGGAVSNRQTLSWRWRF